MDVFGLRTASEMEKKRAEQRGRSVCTLSSPCIERAKK